MHTVAVLEDDPIVRAALREILANADDLRLVAETGRLDQVHIIVDAQPDFILSDLALEDGTAFDFIRTMKENSDAKILIFSVLGDETSVIRAIQAGADGYIKKDSDLSEIEAAIAAVLNDEAPMSSKIARHLMRQISEQPAVLGGSSGPVVNLTDRERQILDCLALGMNYKEAAREFGLSPNTVAKYIKAIYGKFSVNSRAEAVLEGVRQGFISVERTRA